MRLSVVPTNANVVFWLSPAPGAHEFFSALINELAARYDAPRFEPHVTLGSGEFPQERAAEILRNLSIREPIELEVEGIEFSQKYTKTLFVQFRSTPQIEALAAELKTATGSDYQLNPHLSLLYKEMPADEKREAARSISLPFDFVRFETAKAIVVPPTIRGREEVEAWRSIAERPLHSAAE